MASGSAAGAGPAWLRDFFPGYFALVMATGIVALAAHLLHHEALAWPLFGIALAAYPVLWLLLLARLLRFPRAVLADLRSHARGPAFLTIVAANGVLGSGFAAFHLLTGLLPALFWFSAALWLLLIYGFLGAATLGRTKPDLEHGLTGGWLMLVVATQALAVLASALAERTGTPPALTFAALALYLLGSMLYLLLLAEVLLRWTFQPMTPAEMDAPWWISMGAGAISTLAGSRLLALPGVEPHLEPLLRFVQPFTVLLWATSSFWIPLLAIFSVWRVLQRETQGYDPGLWSAVFPLGMYAAATHDYAVVAHLPFLEPIPQVMFWLALAAWTATFIAMWAHLLRR